jgi:hypothetical protein
MEVQRTLEDDMVRALESYSEDCAAADWGIGSERGMVQRRKAGDYDIPYSSESLHLQQNI